MSTNRPVHGLSIFSAALHLLIGAPASFHIGPSLVPPSWTLAYSLLPVWAEPLWPGLFTLTGLVALAGIWHSGALRWAFRLSALAFGIWGCLGFYGMSIGAGGNIPGPAANLLFAGFAWALGHYVSVGETVDRTKLAIIAITDEAVGRTNEGDNGPAH